MSHAWCMLLATTIVGNHHVYNHIMPHSYACQTRILTLAHITQSLHGFLCPSLKWFAILDLDGSSYRDPYYRHLRTPPTIVNIPCQPRSLSTTIPCKPYVIPF